MSKLPSTDVPSLSGPSAARNEASPYRALDQVLLWLVTIALPAAWVLVLLPLAAFRVDPTDSLLEAAPWVVALLPVMICLVTIWALLAHDRLPSTLARGAAQLGCLHFSFLVLVLYESQLRNTPWAMAIGLVLFALPPLIVSAVLRWYRWRLVRGWREGQGIAPLARAFQFRLVDVFAWTTLIAVFLGIGMLLHSRFDKEPTGWDGLGLAVIVILSAYLCIPTGILSVVFTWLVLVEQRRKARGIVALCIALAYAALVVYAVEYGRDGPWLKGDAYFLMITPLALALPALVLLGLARLVGWRMVRLPRPPTACQ